MLTPNSEGLIVPIWPSLTRSAILVYASAKAITHATENIRRIKAFLTKLETTTEGLKAGLAESDELMSASKAVLVGSSSPICPP
jgi:hypothetical protein